MTIYGYKVTHAEHTQGAGGANTAKAAEDAQVILMDIYNRPTALYGHISWSWLGLRAAEDARDRVRAPSHDHIWV